MSPGHIAGVLTPSISQRVEVALHEVFLPSPIEVMRFNRVMHVHGHVAHAQSGGGRRHVDHDRGSDLRIDPHHDVHRLVVPMNASRVIVGGRRTELLRNAFGDVLYPRSQVPHPFCPETFRLQFASKVEAKFLPRFGDADQFFWITHLQVECRATELRTRPLEKRLVLPGAGMEVGRSLETLPCPIDGEGRVLHVCIFGYALQYQPSTLDEWIG
mmetsp:Transcript_19311/g.34951  ORF Transcript_19311/g.34951 Transcript_19311/m.34951 type:complete len:214 (-) Transcript_19311:788-1429(-)